MSAPRRVRLGGDLRHKVVPPGALDVSRPTRWQNPYPVAVFGRVEALRLYRGWLAGDPSAVAVAREHGCKLRLYGPALAAAARDALAGRDLACWCAPDADCHADVLLDLVNVA